MSRLRRFTRSPSTPANGPSIRCGMLCRKPTSPVNQVEPVSRYASHISAIDCAGDPEEQNVVAGFDGPWWDRSAARSAGVASAQPSVENGHNPDENQVSRDVTGPARFRRFPHFRSKAAGSSRVAPPRLVARAAIPDRDPMPPPELARDAPVPDVLQHAVVLLRRALGDDVVCGRLRPPRSHVARAGARAHEPLFRHQRLDRIAGALAVADGGWRPRFRS